MRRFFSGSPRVIGQRRFFVAAAVASLLLAACSDDAGEDGSSSGGGADGGGGAGCDSTRGPAMAKLALNVDTFCVDRTEVTRAQYAAFVADGAPTPASVPDVCKGQGGHIPDPACGAADTLCQGASCGNFPQTCVSYCDAAAFCAWAGKEMCGEIGGGYGVRELGGPRGGGRWVVACGNGLRPDGVVNVPYSYGLSYSPSTCNTETGKAAPVGSLPECSVRPDTTVVDMVGNVGELDGLLFEINATSKIANPRAHGGAGFGFYSGSGAGSCESVFALNATDERQPFIGFRCCKSVNQ